MADPQDDLAALRRVAEAARENGADWYDESTAHKMAADVGGYDGDGAHIAAFSPRVALALLRRLEAAERDVAKLRRFLKISRDEGLEALTNAQTFKEQRDEARRQVQWLMLFGAVADIEAEWRATQQETPDAR